jgi:hypothetical protein
VDFVWVFLHKKRRRFEDVGRVKYRRGQSEPVDGDPPPASCIRLGKGRPRREREREKGRKEGMGRGRGGEKERIEFMYSTLLFT